MLKKHFLAKYNHFIEEKKRGIPNLIQQRDFSIPFPIKVKFDQSYSIYRDNKISISKFTNKLEINLEKISHC
jgi:hypothetical protein